MYSKKFPLLLVMNELVFKWKKTMDMYKGYASPNLKFGLYTKFLQSAWKKHEHFTNWNSLWANWTLVFEKRILATTM